MNTFAFGSRPRIRAGRHNATITNATPWMSKNGSTMVTLMWTLDGFENRPIHESIMVKSPLPSAQGLVEQGLDWVENILSWQPNAPTAFHSSLALAAGLKGIAAEVEVQDAPDRITRQIRPHVVRVFEPPTPPQPPAHVDAAVPSPDAGAAAADVPF
jgi:hypothetical protein